MIQQIQGVANSPSHPSACSRLNFGQSSSGHEKQPPQPLKVLPGHVKRKEQVKQIYVPKKKEEMPAVLHKKLVLLLPLQSVPPKCLLSKLMSRYRGDEGSPHGYCYK
jgi:hypothetical protein